jgi:hypothetical protein
MSGASIQFHKTWIEECEATQGIRDRFGMKSALDYLIGEKLFHFVAYGHSFRSGTFEANPATG